MLRFLIIIFLFFSSTYSLFSQCIDIEGRNYKTIKIGKAAWMAENLGTVKFRNGEAVYFAQSPEDWVEYCNNEKAAYCFLDNDPNKGVIYNWYAVNDPRGLAPEGWHVANDADWAYLAKQYGGWSKAAKKMRYQPKNKKKKATEITFHATVPTRMRYMSGAYEESSDKSYWWSSTPKESGAGYRWISLSADALNSDMCNKRTGYSVRCVKN